MKSLKNLVGMFVVVAALGVVPAFAQNTLRVTADIPFAFTAGNKLLPAGQYTLVAEARSSVARLYDETGKKSVLVLTNSDPGPGYGSSAIMKFNRYGGKNYLAEVWSAAAASGRVLPKTPGERETAKLTAQREVALIQASN
jgi:hypothetical protein